MEVTDIGEALRLIRNGTDINYQGASGEINFDENGDVLGNYCGWSFTENGSIALGKAIELSAAAPREKPTPIPTPTTPGFETALAIFAIIGVTCLYLILQRRA